MKIHKREVNGVKVQAYNDSGADWVILLNGTTYRFPQNKWSMKESIEFAVRVLG